ncbi:MAG: rhamnulokinase [Planctomycetes bacterium]|nr:rhamnulokinase [Planctomycetota bacterium]
MSGAAVLAIDLGAESGRAVLVALDPARERPLTLREVHRFPNAPVVTSAGSRWDVDALFREVLEGLRRGVAAAAEAGLPLRSVGVDAWGVDFALLDAAGGILAPPLCYRDPLAQEAFEEVTAAVGRERLYATTGTQFLPFNTIYQLAGLRRREPRLLEAADRLLFLPDLMHFLLTGVRATEGTIASTAQMTDPATGDWARGLCAELGLPERLLGEIVPTGSVLGGLLPQVREAIGAGAELQVVAPATHDTASAVLAVPAAADRRWAFLSSGTWSLLGVERRAPLLGPAACAASFTNEWGMAGSFRFLKNITGLWLVQECRRAFARGGAEFSYEELARLAAAAGPSPTRLDLAAEPLLAPGDMPAKIQAWARRTGQPVPEDPSALVRCCLDGLAEAYAATLTTLEELTGETCEVLHVVGGGARNTLLNRLTAAATGRRVVAGPDEATAIGNALSQMIGLGLVRGVKEAREVVRASLQLEVFEPEG